MAVWETGRRHQLLSSLAEGVLVRGITHTSGATSGYHPHCLGVSHTFLRGITHKTSGYHTPHVRGITHTTKDKNHKNQRLAEVINT